MTADNQSAGFGPTAPMDDKLDAELEAILVPPLATTIEDAPLLVESDTETETVDQAAARFKAERDAAKAARKTRSSASKRVEPIDSSAKEAESVSVAIKAMPDAPTPGLTPRTVMEMEAGRRTLGVTSEVTRAAQSASTEREMAAGAKAIGNLKGE